MAESTSSPVPSNVSISQSVSSQPSIYPLAPTAQYIVQHKRSYLQKWVYELKLKPTGRNRVHLVRALLEHFQLEGELVDHATVMRAKNSELSRELDKIDILVDPMANFINDAREKKLCEESLDWLQEVGDRWLQEGNLMVKEFMPDDFKRDHCIVEQIKQIPKLIHDSIRSVFSQISPTPLTFSNADESSHQPAVTSTFESPPESPRSPPSPASIVNFQDLRESLALIDRKPALPIVCNAREVIAQVDSGELDRIRKEIDDIDKQRTLKRSKQKVMGGQEDGKMPPTVWSKYKKKFSKRRIIYSEFVRFNKDWEMFEAVYSDTLSFEKLYTAIVARRKSEKVDLLVREKEKDVYRDDNGNFDKGKWNDAWKHVGTRGKKQRQPLDSSIADVLWKTKYGAEANED